MASASSVENSGGAGRANRIARIFLSGSAIFWFAVAALGQWVFLYYIAAFYGPSTLSGNIQAWTKNHALLKGYVPGDTAGNFAFGAHALLVAYVTFGGVLQVIPQLRRWAPRLHRWNGRAFVVTAIGVSLTGLYMVWVRGATINLTGSVAISGNALAILLCAVLAWRAALLRDFASHKRWALRTWLVANGQWFFRVGIFGWILLNRAPVGLGKNFDGPVVVFCAFGCYLVPLAALEVYFRAQAAGPGVRTTVAAGLLATALLIALGTFGAWLMIWQPVLARL